jgi:hypothetical protein
MLISTIVAVLILGGYGMLAVQFVAVALKVLATLLSECLPQANPLTLEVVKENRYHHMPNCHHRRRYGEK